MTKKIAWSVLIFALLVFSYFQLQQIKEARIAEITARVGYAYQAAEIDKAFLKKLSTRSSSLSTGDYILEEQFSDKPFEKREVHLKFTNDQFEHAPWEGGRRADMMDSLSIEGQIISWHSEGIMYDGGIAYIGLIDGEIAWGRAYDGNGDKNHVGFWQLYKKPEK